MVLELIYRGSSVSKRPFERTQPLVSRKSATKLWEFRFSGFSGVFSIVGIRHKSRYFPMFPGFLAALGLCSGVSLTTPSLLLEDFMALSWDFGIIDPQRRIYSAESVSFLSGTRVELRAMYSDFRYFLEIDRSRIDPE